MHQRNKARYSHFYSLIGLACALITLAIGARSIIVLELGAGLLFSAILLTVDLLLQRRRPSPHVSSGRRLWAGLILTIACVCGVLAFVGVASSLEHIGTTSRNLLGLIVAAIIGSFATYWSLKLLFNVKIGALVSLLLIGFSAALVSGTAAI